MDKNLSSHCDAMAQRGSADCECTNREGVNKNSTCVL